VKGRHVDEDDERGTRRIEGQDVCRSTVWQLPESGHVAAQWVTKDACWDASVCRKQHGSTPYNCTVLAFFSNGFEYSKLFSLYHFPVFVCSYIFIQNRGSQVQVDMTGKDP